MIWRDPLRGKHEARSTKSETNSNEGNEEMSQPVSDIAFSCLPFVSDFVLRASDFPGTGRRGIKRP
jgi:hypothetical protein